MNDDQTAMTPSYSTYLQLPTLLAAQRPPHFEALGQGDDPRSITRDLAHHGELLFIVVHQTFELWFRLVVHELSAAMTAIRSE